MPEMTLEERIARVERLLVALNPTALRCPQPWTPAQWEQTRDELSDLAWTVTARLS